MKVLENIIVRKLCFMHLGIFRPDYIPVFNNDAYFCLFILLFIYCFYLFILFYLFFFYFHARKFPLIYF